MVMPSKTRSAKRVRITRSLKVPGSPSSALQMMYFWSAFSAAQKPHFMPVGKPAPPRPLRSLSRTVSTSTARLSLSAAVSPASGSMVS